MMETELKIRPEEGELARLRKLPALADLRCAEPRTETLVSVYYDTPDQALLSPPAWRSACAGQGGAGSRRSSARRGARRPTASFRISSASSRSPAGGWS